MVSIEKSHRHLMKMCVIVKLWITVKLKDVVVSVMCSIECCIKMCCILFEWVMFVLVYYYVSYMLVSLMFAFRSSEVLFIKILFLTLLDRIALWKYGAFWFINYTKKLRAHLISYWAFLLTYRRKNAFVLFGRHSCSRNYKSSVSNLKQNTLTSAVNCFCSV